MRQKVHSGKLLLIIASLQDHLSSFQKIVFYELLISGLPPIPGLKLVAEIQYVNALKVHSIGWCICTVFNEDSRLNRGRWKAPVFVPPPIATAGKL